MPKARILVVDDQAYFRALVSDLLTREGFAVEAAEGPHAALRCLEHERFDVVVTDLEMPELSGVELVDRIRESWPEQAVVLLTSHDDVRVAVDAMRRGAADYVLKPVDGPELVASLEGILQQRRIRQERQQLLSENLEYLGILSLYERALSFVATLSLDALAERVIEGLCLETRAQGGVLWLARPDDPDRLELAAVRGLVDAGREPERLDLTALEPALEALQHPSGAAFVAEAGSGGQAGTALYVPLRHAGFLAGAARLTDPLSASGFGARERAVAERLAEPAAIAAANALRHRALESRTFRDPVTKAYTWAYFEDVLRNELEKASRFGRPLSLVRLELDGLPTLRAQAADVAVVRWLERLVGGVGQLLRASDLLAQETERQYALLLPETDAIGAAVLKRRIRERLDQSELLEPAPDTEPIRVRLATATAPVDGSTPEALERALSQRLAADRHGPVERLGLAGRSFASALEALASEARPMPAATVEQILGFVLEELDRRATERGLFCIAPGSAQVGLARDALSRLDPVATRTEVVLVTDQPVDALEGSPVERVSPQRARTQRPFVVYYAEGPSYALVGDPTAGSAQARAFHTSDRALVEHLAFELQRDLGIPVGR